jgi:hypothetical protein
LLFGTNALLGVFAEVGTDERAHSIIMERGGVEKIVILYVVLGVIIVASAWTSRD